MSALKILCVDDDRAVLDSLGDVLRHHGFQVSGVATVPEALELISREPFDVLLADLNVGQPGDGFTVVSAMRRVQPNACTFILTGYPDIESAIRAIRSQVDDYFSKPLKIEELLSAISSVASGRRVPAKPMQLLKVFELVEKQRSEIYEQWYEEVMRIPELAAIPLTKVDRVDHLPRLLDELVERMGERDGELSEEQKEASRVHGQVRYEQGYTIPQVLLEMRILQHVLSETIQRELLGVELSTLVPDVFWIGQSLQAALEVSIRAYQAQVPHSLQTSFSGLYKSPHLGVVIADEHRVIEANDAFLRMVGYTREQLMGGGIDWVAMTPEKYRELDVSAVEQLREYGACVPFEKEFVLADGTMLPFLIGAVRLSYQPLQWCAYVADLTQQRRLKEVEQKVRESESRTQLINRLAHEINNPLAALMFTFYLLTTQAGLTGDARELLRNAGEMLGRVNESVKKVLIESRL